MSDWSSTGGGGRGGGGGGRTGYTKRLIVVVLVVDQVDVVIEERRLSIVLSTSVVAVEASAGMEGRRCRINEEEKCWKYRSLIYETVSNWDETATKRTSAIYLTLTKTSATILTRIFFLFYYSGRAQCWSS